MPATASTSLSSHLMNMTDLRRRPAQHRRAIKTVQFDLDTCAAKAERLSLNFLLRENAEGKTLEDKIISHVFKTEYLDDPGLRRKLERVPAADRSNVELIFENKELATLVLRSLFSYFGSSVGTRMLGDLHEILTKHPALVTEPEWERPKKK